MKERSQKYKGTYTPEHPAKYTGDSTNIIYRSMWERRCMKYFDVNPSVLQWSSEEVVIPYYDSMSKKVRRYFPDFLIKVKTENPEYDLYVKQTISLHQILVSAMKCKQTIDEENVNLGIKLIDQFAELYFDSHGLEHLQKLSE